MRGVFSALETAIVLIAFVVVASVFAFTMLSAAGMFSTERSKEAVYAGLEEVAGSMELRGEVVAQTNVAGDAIDQLEFTVSNVAGGEAIDMTDTSGAKQDRDCLPRWHPDEQRARVGGDLARSERYRQPSGGGRAGKDHDHGLGTARRSQCLPHPSPRTRFSAWRSSPHRVASWSWSAAVPPPWIRNGSEVK